MKKPSSIAAFTIIKERATLWDLKKARPPVDSTASFGQRPPKPCLCFLLYSVFFAASSDLFEAVSVRPSRILGAARDEGYYSEVSKLLDSTVSTCILRNGSVFFVKIRMVVFF